MDGQMYVLAIGDAITEIEKTGGGYWIMIDEFCELLLNNDANSAKSMVDKMEQKDLSLIESLIVPSMILIGEMWKKRIVFNEYLILIYY